MDEPPKIRLDHVNLPALSPHWLADQYAENFGFRCASRSLVKEWAVRLEASLMEEESYCGFKTEDPKGNMFEVFWES